MQFKGQPYTLALLVAKVLKIIGIKLGFIWPTFRLKLLLKLYGCTYGNNLRAAGYIILRPTTSNTITLGSNVTLMARFLTNTVGITNPIVLETVKNGRIQIGNNTGLTSVIISSRTLVKIGNFVKIGANVRIYDHDYHSLDNEHRRNSQIDNFNTKTESIVIEDDVFIGTNAIILKGVHVGAGSVIGAGSIVSMRHIPANSLVVGNPAKVIKKLITCSYENK